MEGDGDGSSSSFYTTTNNNRISIAPYGRDFRGARHKSLETCMCNIRDSSRLHVLKTSIIISNTI